MPPLIELPLTHVIDTPRCRLRAPAEADIPHIFDATRFKGFNDGMTWDPPETPAELHVFLAKTLQAWREGKAFTFRITRRPDDIFLGSIAIRQVTRPGVWDIGYWTHPNHQRCGYMRESARAILSFGFDVLGATAIEACYATWNQASQRVLETIGMTFVEHVPHGFMKNGAWVAENRMSDLPARRGARRSSVLKLTIQKL